MQSMMEPASFYCLLKASDSQECFWVFSHHPISSPFSLAFQKLIQDFKTKHVFTSIRCKILFHHPKYFDGSPSASGLENDLQITSSQKLRDAYKKGPFCTGSKIPEGIWLPAPHLAWVNGEIQL